MKLPSAPLLPASNLTEQLLFPNLLREYKGSKSLLELRIQQVLKKLRLTHLSHRFQGFSEISFEDWHSLSNGEKQRIGFARLFLAQDLPIYTFKLAFLDESSSSIDPKMEQIIYEECKRKNIQLVSIEHRENISNHYDFLLKLNTNRTVSFTELGPHDQAVVNQTSLLGEIEKEKADCSYVSILGWLCVSTIVVLF